MRQRQMRTAVRKRIRGSFAERGRAIRRQRAQGNIPALVVQPSLGIAARARDFERVAIVLQEHDMVGETAKAAQHHVFVAGKFFAGRQRGLPLAPQNRNVFKQFGFDSFALHSHHLAPAPPGGIQGGAA
jgi:hypothetical protein